MPKPLPPSIIVADQHQTLGKRILQIRERAGLTQAKVAEISGLYHTDISKIENDHAPNMKLFKLDRIARALGCELVISLREISRPKRAAARISKAVLRDAQRPVPRTLEGARMRAESHGRSPPLSVPPQK